MRYSQGTYASINNSFSSTEKAVLIRSILGDKRNYYFSDPRKIEYFTQISKTLQFKVALPIKCKVVQGYYELNYNIGTLSVVASGQSIEEARRDFLDEIEHAWNYYAKEDDTNLTDKAQVVKKWLNNNIIEG